jgi:hypothetical protein
LVPEGYATNTVIGNVRLRAHGFKQIYGVPQPGLLEPLGLGDFEAEQAQGDYFGIRAKTC